MTSLDAPPILLGTQAAAAALSIHERTLRRLVSDGAIPVVRIGRRVLYRPADLEQWAASAAH